MAAKINKTEGKKSFKEKFHDYGTFQNRPIWSE